MAHGTRLSALVLFVASVAWATCVPFGGDDSGCVPPSATVEKCESRVATDSGTKLVGGILRCHQKAVDAAIRGLPFQEEECEDATAARFESRAEISGCPCVEVDELSDVARTLADQNNGLIYCEGSVPLGGDDAGFVPSNSVPRRCEHHVNRASAKLVVGVLNCHRLAARAAVFGQTFDEESCEQRAVAKFLSTNITDCGCVNLPALAALVTTQLDVGNFYFYCMSPGGAFLDATGR